MSAESRFDLAALEAAESLRSGRAALRSDALKAARLASSLGSFEVPNLGGSSTASIQPFERMQSEGRDVHYVNLIHRR